MGKGKGCVERPIYCTTDRHQGRISTHASHTASVDASPCNWKPCLCAAGAERMNAEFAAVAAGGDKTGCGSERGGWRGCESRRPTATAPRQGGEGGGPKILSKWEAGGRRLFTASGRCGASVRSGAATRSCAGTCTFYPPPCRKRRLAGDERGGLCVCPPAPIRAR
jgi:hypothetical protein